MNSIFLIPQDPQSLNACQETQMYLMLWYLSELCYSHAWITHLCIIAMQISKDPFQRKIASVSFKHQSISKDHLLKQVQALNRGYRSQQTKYEVWWCSDGLNPSTS